MVLQNELPKDLINIIEEYSKDRTNYELVIRELNFMSFILESQLRRTGLKKLFTYHHASFAKWNKMILKPKWRQFYGQKEL